MLSANSDDYMALYLAIPWAGAVLVPLNYRWSETENRFAIDDCTPGLVFVSDELADANAEWLEASSLTLVSLGHARSGWHTLDDLLANVPVEDAGRGRRRSACHLLHRRHHWALQGRDAEPCRTGRQLRRDAGVRPVPGRVPHDHCPLPLFHLAAAATLTTTMLSGGTAVIEQAFDAAATLDHVAAESATDAMLVPTMIQMMLDAPGFDPAKLVSMRRILYGASPMPEATLDRIMAAAPHIDFVQAYGMTEVSCTATLLGAEYHVGEHRAAGRHRGAGHPLPIAELAIVGRDRRARPGRRGGRDPGAQPRCDARLLEPARPYRGDASRGMDARPAMAGRLDDHGHPLRGRPAEGP